MFFHMNPFICSFGGLMMIFPIVFWILLVVLIVKLFQEKKNNPKEIGNKALNILKERFARGEIDEEEYLRKKELLEK